MPQQDPTFTKNYLDSKRQDDLYYSALAKMKEGLPVTPEEQAVVRMQQAILKRAGQ